MPNEDSDILREIRENYDYASSYWRETRERASLDMQYQVQGPWTEKDLADRAGRPSLVLDELGQYINQVENQFRVNKRSVKVNPRGNGANDQTALQRADMIREIEYQSRAQHAYVVAGSSMVERSYGYFKLITDWEPGTMNRVIRIVPIPNPDVIYLDPDYKEADASDCGWSYEIERMRERVFKKRFGSKATITDFTADHMEQAPGWIISGDNGKYVQVAAYCRLETNVSRICTLQDGSTVNLGDRAFKGVRYVKQKDQEFLVMPNGDKHEITESREDNQKSVTQYISNGVEVLEKTKLDWEEIPIIPMFGKEKWLTTQGVSKRTFLSLPRLALDAYKAYCYTRSSQLERLGQDPKTPYEGWEGQFDTETDWETLGRNPVGYVEFRPITLPNGQIVMDKPARNQTEPQITQYEVAAEAFRRAIQAAMGGSPLPTAAQRQNEKSGVALSKIEQSSDEGNFHFIDNYDRALERSGRMMDAALEIVYDTPRDHGFRDESGNYRVQPINQVDAAGKPVGFQTANGDHGVTITTGPSSDSQRDAVDDFVEQLIQNPQVLGPALPKVMALLVKLKNLGPVGDQVAKLIDPDMGNDAIPPQVQAQMAQAQALIQQLTAELQAAKSGDAIKKYTVDEQEKTKRVLGLLKVDQQDAETLLEQELGVIGPKVDRMHEALQNYMQQQHEKDMQSSDQAAAASSQGADQAHQAMMAQQAQEATANQPEAVQ